MKYCSLCKRHAASPRGWSCNQARMVSSRPCWNATQSSSSLYVLARRNCSRQEIAIFLLTSRLILLLLDIIFTFDHTQFTAILRDHLGSLRDRLWDGRIILPVSRFKIETSAFCIRKRQGGRR